MANSPSKIVLVAAAVMGIGAMVVLNSMNKTPKGEEEQEQEEAAAAQKNAPPPTAPVGMPGKGGVARNVRPMLNPAAGGANEKSSALVGLGEDKVVGSSAVGPEVNIRYSWTPAVQSDPNKVYDAVAAVKAAAPNARIHIVNTDDKPGVKDGVFVGDKMLSPAAADGSISVNSAAVKSAVAGGSKK